MIDIFTLALTHGLMAFAAVRLLSRDDLDDEAAGGAKVAKPWLANRRPLQQGDSMTDGGEAGDA